MTSVEESPSWLGKTTKKVWSFLTIPIKKLFVFNFILALFEKNVLLTPKIKNTNLVALESVESLYHNIGLQINNKNVPIFTETWQLMIKHWYRFLRRFSADFVSIKYSSTLSASLWHINLLLYFTFRKYCEAARRRFFMSPNSFIKTFIIFSNNVTIIIFKCKA